MPYLMVQLLNCSTLNNKTLKSNFFHAVFFLMLLQHYSCAQSITPAGPTNSGAADSVLPGNLKPVKFIAGNYSMLEVDNLNFIYLLNESGQLKKLNPNGDSLLVFNDVKKYGNPGLVDVSNPLKVLLFYKPYASIVLLDKMLTLRNSLNLRKINIFSVNAIANAYDNSIWVFDEQDFTLKKISEQGQVIQESNDMRLFPGIAPQVSSITDHNNFVYLYDKDNGFFVFDYYGTFKNTLAFKNWGNISFSGNILYGTENNRLHIYRIDNQKETVFEMPQPWKDGISIKAMNGKLYVLKKEGLEIYNL